uniref:C2h2-type zn-finger protein n=1 Tax=Culex tarsalis TaxID=7177 RepID=A0A1Q3F1V8_CULTA
MNHLCRICMGTFGKADDPPAAPPEAISLYSELATTGEVVANMIIDCGDIVVCHDDQLPEFVCVGCLARLEDAFALRKLIRESDKALRTMAAIKTQNLVVEGEEEIRDGIVRKVSSKVVNYPSDEQIESVQEVDCYKIIRLRGIRCCGCNSMLGSQQEVDQHSKEMHGSASVKQEPNQFECPTCHKLFENKLKLLNHSKNFQSNEVYHCTVCDVLFDIRYRLEQHLKLSKAHRSPKEETTIKQESTKLNLERKRTSGRRKATRELKYPEQDFILAIEETPEYQLIHIGGERCCGCERIFKTYQQLQEHCNAAHFPCPESALCECGLCFEKFDQIQSYHRHTTARNLKELYYCKFCKIVIDAKFRFDQHLKSSLAHQASREQAGIEPGPPLVDFPRALEAGIEVLRIYDVRCCGCDFTCLTRNELEDHSEETHGFQRITADSAQNRYECDICFQRFPTAQLLKFHKNAALQTTVFKCAQCDVQSEIKQRLLQHLASADHDAIPPKATTSSSHNKPKPRKLQQQQHLCCFVRCTASFPSPPDLLAHVQSEHAAKRLENAEERELDGPICYVCHKSFRTERALHVHQFPKNRRADRAGTPNVCGECGAAFQTASGLTQHVKGHAAERWEYQCDVCDRRCPDEVALRLHRVCHDDERRWECEVCGKRFRRKGNLKVHKRCHREVSIWECPHCGTGFKTKQSLTLHIRSHTGEKPFQCRFCENRYSHTTDRQRHEMASHTKERPHRCDLCPAAFVRKRQLTIHVRTHTGERPFVCQVCGRGFIQLNYLKKHLTTHDKTKEDCLVTETEYMIEMLQDVAEEDEEDEELSETEQKPYYELEIEPMAEETEEDE